MSPELEAVIVGVICGIAAGIPTSLLLLYWMGHIEERRQRPKLPPIRRLRGTVMIIEPDFDIEPKLLKSGNDET